MDRRKVIIGDADAIVALFYKNDKLHQIAIKISNKLASTGVDIIIPHTALVEAMTVLQTKLSSPELADHLHKRTRQGVFIIEYIDEELDKVAGEYFNPLGPKHNTYFDSLVAATAKKLSVDTIFSFDKWYQKLGFKLASEQV